MTVPERIEDLVAIVEEEFEDVGYVGLYQFSWSQRGPGSEFDQLHVEATARAAYGEFVKRHDVRLVWSPWPIDLDAAKPAADDVEIDLDLDPDSPPDLPLLVLVPHHPLKCRRTSYGQSQGWLRPYDVP